MIRKHQWGVTRTLLTVGAMLALAFGGTVACSQSGQEPFKDAPHAPGHLRPVWTLVESPDGFSNEATACLVLADGTHTGIRMFVAYHGGGHYAAVNQLADPSCR
jgi:hypothetical protein